MADIVRPEFSDDPVLTQRTATAAVLIDPATGRPYNGNTGEIYHGTLVPNQSQVEGQNG